MKILLVDDSTIVRERLKAMLSEVIESESIALAKDPVEAMEFFRQLNPDVVILDIRMPGGSGIDLLQKIRQSNQTSLVIVLSNYPSDQYLRKCMAVGANFFFNKSTEFHKVTEVIRELIHNSCHSVLDNP